MARPQTQFLVALLALGCTPGDPPLAEGTGGPTGALPCQPTADSREQCDGLDNDCDGTVDLAPSGVGLCEARPAIGNSVDVLFVVDNSARMLPFQETLADSAPTLVAALDEVDAHFGVISTDVASDNGRLEMAAGQKWVDRATEGPEDVLRGMMQLGEGGSHDERGRDCAYLALDILDSPGAFNDGFLRSSAPLEVVILSNEDDQSDGIDLDEWEAYLTSLRPQGTPVRQNAIVDLGNACGDTIGDSYVDTAEATGGFVVDLCDPSYAQPLLDILAEHTQPPPDERLEYALHVDLDPDTLTAEALTDQGGVVAQWDVGRVAWDPVAEVATLDIPAPATTAELVFHYAELPPPAADPATE